VIAVYLYVNATPHPVRLGEGALLGGMAGLIGTVISWIVGIPLGLITGDVFTKLWIDLMVRLNPAQEHILRQQMEAAQHAPWSQRLTLMALSMVVGLFFYLVFAVGGGLLGIAIFEKRKGEEAPPPPPPPYGGPQ
jgi:hypothetical protein